MTLYQAYAVLRHHAEWREGKRDEMVKADKLSQALHIVLNYLENKLIVEAHATV